MNLLETLGRFIERGIDYNISLSFQDTAIDSYLRAPYHKGERVGPGQASSYTPEIVRLFSALKAAQQELLSFRKKKQIYDYWRWIYQESVVSGQNNFATMTALSQENWPFRGAVASSQSPNLDNVVLGGKSFIQLTVQKTPPLTLTINYEPNTIRSAGWLGPELTTYNRSNPGTIFLLDSSSDEVHLLGSKLITPPKTLSEERRLGASSELALINRKPVVALVIFPHGSLQQNTQYDIELSATGFNGAIWKDFTSDSSLGWNALPTNLENHLMVSATERELLIEYALRRYQVESQRVGVSPLNLERIDTLESYLVKERREVLV